MRYYTVTMQSGHTYMAFTNSEEEAMVCAEQLAMDIHGERDEALAAVVCNDEWTRL